MNRIKIIKKSEIIKRTAVFADASEIPEARFDGVEMQKTVGNWVSDWRKRNETEKRRSLEYVTRLKLKLTI